MMKPTYYLVGVSWDHQPCEALPAHPDPLDPEVAELGSAENLFDAHGCRRYVRISTLLACGDIHEIDALVTSGRGCDELDGKPGSRSETHFKILKREEM